ncbi:MAG: two-component system OmpR family response regulator [Clostridium sp.]|jgi:two-component system OmpR family response regulator
MNKKLIYIADDEINICNIIKSFLVKAGFEVEIFKDGRSILKAFNARRADMLVIDIMMPEIDGYSLCSQIRAKSSVPIIIVSAKDRSQDKIDGLTLGGDDYLTKPFSPLELIARVHSIFRRIELDKTPISNNRIIKIYDVTINLDTKQVEVNGKAIGLTGMELSLLYYLTVNKNRAVSRSELLDKIWGFENRVETRATDDMIKRIRKKLCEAGSIFKIETIWGFGFTIQEKEGYHEKEHDKMESF